MQKLLPLLVAAAGAMVLMSPAPSAGSDASALAPLPAFVVAASLEPTPFDDATIVAARADASSALRRLQDARP